MKLTVPRSSSAPQRPQFETCFAMARTLSMLRSVACPMLLAEAGEYTGLKDVGIDTDTAVELGFRIRAHAAERGAVHLHVLRARPYHGAAGDPLLWLRGAGALIDACQEL